MSANYTVEYNTVKFLLHRTENHKAKENTEANAGATRYVASIGDSILVLR